MNDKPCFFQSGEAETVKAAAHVLLGLTAMTCFAYNATAFARRSSEKRHLALNAVLYGALVCYEATLIRHHWSER